MPTFATSEPISATVDIVGGHIRIVAGDRTDTVVEVQARDDCNGLDAKTASQTRVDLIDGKLTVKSPKPLQVFFGPWSAEVDVTIELPTGSDIHATTMQGDIICQGTLGSFSARTYDGDIAVHRVASLRATTTDGRITCDRVTGDAHVTGSGDVMLTEVGGAASVKNLNGPSWIGQAGGDVNVNSAHGDVTIDRAGSEAVARTAHGDVRLSSVTRGSAVLQTASGEIEIGVRAGTAAWLDLKSSAGSIRNELDTSSAPEEPQETAQIRARTWDGDIVVRRAPA